MRPLLRCAGLSATVQKIVQAPVPDSPRRLEISIRGARPERYGQIGGQTRGDARILIDGNRGEIEAIRVVFVIPYEWPRKINALIIGRLRFIIGLLRAARDHPFLSEFRATTCRRLKNT